MFPCEVMLLNPGGGLRLVGRGQGAIDLSVVAGGQGLTDIVQRVFQAPDLLRKRL